MPSNEQAARKVQIREKFIIEQTSCYSLKLIQNWLFQTSAFQLWRIAKIEILQIETHLSDPRQSQVMWIV